MQIVVRCLTSAEACVSGAALSVVTPFGRLLRWPCLVQSLGMPICAAAQHRQCGVPFSSTQSAWSMLQLGDEWTSNLLFALVPWLTNMHGQKPSVAAWFWARLCPLLLWIPHFRLLPCTLWVPRVHNGFRQVCGPAALIRMKKHSSCPVQLLGSTCVCCCWGRCKFGKLPCALKAHEGSWSLGRQASCPMVLTLQSLFSPSTSGMPSIYFSAVCSCSQMYSQMAKQGPEAEENVEAASFVTARTTTPKSSAVMENGPQQRSVAEPDPQVGTELCSLLQQASLAIIISSTVEHMRM